MDWDGRMIDDFRDTERPPCFSRRENFFAFVCMLHFFAGAALAGDSFSFVPKVDVGDVIRRSTKTETTATISSDGQPIFTNTSSEESERLLTFVAATAEHAPIEYTLKINWHEVAEKTERNGQTAKNKRSAGFLDGATLRYRAAGKEFLASIIDGTASPKLIEHVAEPHHFPLGEELLPDRPLAVGESTALSDPIRLAEILRSYGDKAKFAGPVTVRFVEIKKANSARLAIIRQDYAVEIETALRRGVVTKTRMTAITTTEYDLDRQRVANASIDVSGVGSATHEGKQFTVATKSKSITTDKPGEHENP